MAIKNFRLNDIDIERLELIKSILNEKYGIDTDVGVFRYLLVQATRYFIPDNSAKDITIDGVGNIEPDKRVIW